MYRILVVDDEQYITDTIADFISEINNDLFEVYKAYLPTAALELAQSTKIDILITDIDMPSMDGFALSERVCGRWPRCKVLILSAYNDSDYMQKALRQNIIDYVLKAEGEGVIIKAVNKAVDLLNAEIDRELMLESARKNSERFKAYLKEKIVYDLAANRLSADEISGNCRKYGIHIDTGKMLLLLTANVTLKSDGDYFHYVSRLMEIELLIANHLNQTANIEYGIYNGSRIMFIIQSSEEYPDLGVIREYLKDTLPLIQEKAREAYDCSVSFVMADEEFPADRLYEYFSKLNSLISGRHFVNSDALIEIGLEDSFILDGETSGRLELYSNEISMLETFLDNGQYDSFRNYLESIFQRLGGTSADDAGIKSISYSISSLLLNYSRNKMLYGDRDNSRLVKGIASLLNAGSLTELKKVTEDYIALLEKETIQDDYGEYECIIGSIFEYVDRHINTDISLTQIADQVHFNPSYLSRLFKKTTGKTISEYVWEVKLARAKEMMARDELKISEISVSLGFESRAYFTRFFKRMTGKTPVEYRRILFASNIDEI